MWLLRSIVVKVELLYFTSHWYRIIQGQKEERARSLLPSLRNLIMLILFDTALKQNCRNYFDLRDFSERTDICINTSNKFHIGYHDIILRVLSKSILSFTDPANSLCRSSILIRRNEYSRVTAYCDVECKYSIFHIDHTSREPWAGFLRFARNAASPRQWRGAGEGSDRPSRQ